MKQSAEKNLLRRVHNLEKAVEDLLNAKCGAKVAPEPVKVTPKVEAKPAPKAEEKKVEPPKVAEKASLVKGFLASKKSGRKSGK